MDLSIIIVNWNSIDYLRQCVVSIQDTARGLDYEIIVVDNASEEDCRGIGTAFPSITLVLSDRNLGFAAANNLGVDHSCGRTILFLNPDTVVTTNALERMLQELHSATEIGAVGCRLLNRDLSLQMSCVQPFPTIINQLLAIDWLRRRWPMLPLWGMSALFAEQGTGIHEVDVVSGACLMVRRESFEKVGRFSTEYFMYAEEIDLCYKLRHAGYKVCYVPEAEVIHFGGQSTKKKGDGFSDVLMRESVFVLLRKCRGKLYAQLYRVSLLFSAAIRIIVLLPLLAIASVVPGSGDLLCSFRKWYKIAKWSLSLESWARQLCDIRSNRSAVKS